MNAKRLGRFVPFLFSAFFAGSLISGARAQKRDAAYHPTVPRTWDEQALADLEVPLADPSNSPKDISADDYGLGRSEIASFDPSTNCRFSPVHRGFYIVSSYTRTVLKKPCNRAHHASCRLLRSAEC
jgi:hypothetical protein